MNVTGGCIFTDSSETSTFHVRKYKGKRTKMQVDPLHAYRGTAQQRLNSGVWASQWLKIATFENGAVEMHGAFVGEYLRTVNRVPELRVDGTRNFEPSTVMRKTRPRGLTLRHSE